MSLQLLGHSKLFAYAYDAALAAVSRSYLSNAVDPILIITSLRRAGGFQAPSDANADPLPKSMNASNLCTYCDGAFLLFSP